MLYSSSWAEQWLPNSDWSGVCLYCQGYRSGERETAITDKNKLQQGGSENYDNSGGYEGEERNGGGDGSGGGGGWR